MNQEVKKKKESKGNCSGVSTEKAFIENGIDVIAVLIKFIGQIMNYIMIFLIN